MIVTPDIFSQIKGQLFLSDTTFCGQSFFKVTPKTFQPIDMISFAVTVLAFMVFDKAVHPLAATPVLLARLIFGGSIAEVWRIM